MLISLDRPSPISWGITGTGTSFVTSSSYLSDGKVAIPCRMTWLSKTPATSDTVAIGASLSGTLNACRVVAILCPKSAYALPVGLPVSISITTSGSPVTASGTIQQFWDGSTGVIFYVASAPNAIGLSITLTNNISGSTYFAASQNFDVGEIWFGSGTDWKISNTVQDGVTDPTTNRRSHNNEPWPLFVKPYSTLVTDFAPMNDSSAYNPNTAISFKQMRYALTTAQAALILPRYFTPGTSTVDQIALHQLAIFGRPDSMQPLKGNGDRFWTAQLTFSQAPP